MKNVLIYILVLMLALPICFGASVDLSPITAYEAIDSDYVLNVDNYLGSIINQIVLNSQLDIIDVADYNGWTNDFSLSHITWSDGTIETNVKSALFEYSASAPIVDEDTVYEISGTLYFADTTQDFSINLTILNDTTSPVLDSVFPADTSYARAYNNNQPIRLVASDPETGIKSVKYTYSDCTNNVTEVALACNGTSCEGIADFSAYGEADNACFIITLTNNAGDSNTITGSFGFDETPPTVDLINPINDDYAGLTEMFSFNVEDNKANEFQCTVSVDGNDVQSLDAFTGVNAFALNASIAEGLHSWKISCLDVVELEGSDTDSFIYDTTPPVITLNSPSNSAAIKDAVIDISVNDNYAVQDTDYSLDLDSSSWSAGWNTLTVTSTDIAGNVAVAEFQFYVDRTAPVIDISSPADNADIDYHGNFVITATDDFDLSIECALSTSTAAPVSQNLESGVESTITSTLPLGAFTWNLLCVDDLGNSVQTSTMNANSVDLSGPDIVLNDLGYVARGSDITVTATITDISGVKDAYALFEGNNIVLTASGDVYTGAYTTDSGMTPGDYSVQVFATDMNDIDNSVSGTVVIVESYTINLNVPSSVSPGNSMTVSGSVVKDDSSPASGNVEIIYPGGLTDVVLDANGEFVYEITSPSSAGTYDIKVSYETDSLVYSKTKSFEVVNPPAQQSSESTGWAPNWNNLEDKGVVEPPASEPAGEASASELIQPAEPETPIIEEVPAEEPRTPIGAGQATGIFGLLGKTAKWWVIILTSIGLVAGSVYAFKKSKKKGDSLINWGNKFK